MNSASRKLFISTVSDEFRSYRDILVADLKGPLLEAKVQEDFVGLGGDTLQLLEEYIKVCDGVIHLIGEATGGSPPQSSVKNMLKRLPDFSDRVPFLGQLLPPTQFSYTQWEAYLAIYYGKKLWIYKPSPDAPRDPKFVRSEDERNLQLQHLQRLQQVDRWPGGTFISHERLSKFVLSAMANWSTESMIGHARTRKSGKALAWLLGIGFVVLGLSCVFLYSRSQPDSRPDIKPVADRPIIKEIVDQHRKPDFVVGNMNEAIDQLAHALDKEIRSLSNQSVQFADFVDATRSGSQQEVGVQIGLRSRMRSLGIETRTDSSVPIVAGAIAVRPAERPGLPGRMFSGVLIQVSLYRSDSTLHHRYAAMVPDPQVAGNIQGMILDDAGAGASLIDHEEKLETSSRIFPLVERGTLRAGKDSPFGLYVRKKSHHDPLPLLIRDRQAWVDLDHGDEFVVGLVNLDDKDAAVDLSLDGINIFETGSIGAIRHIIVPAGQTREVPGWYEFGEDGRGIVKQFVVTDYSGSVAFERKRTEGMGIVSARFFRVWNDAAPEPEERGRLTRGVPGYGIGRGDANPAAARIKDLSIGRQRAGLHIRYRVPDSFER